MRPRAGWQVPYEAIERAPSVTRVASLNPRAMVARDRFDRALQIGASCLGPVREEFLAAVVSAALESTC